MADFRTLARHPFSSKWLLVLVTGTASAVTAVAVTLATHPGDAPAATPAAASPGRWVTGQTRAAADQEICAGHTRAAALMRSAARVATVDKTGYRMATGRYDQAAATMYRATSIDAHFDLSFAADTFTAALRTLVTAPAMPEALAAAGAADETVTAMCARRAPDASGEPTQ